MTLRSGPGGPGSGSSGPKTTPRAPQWRPMSAQERSKGGQKSLINEIRLPVGSREPFGSHFGAMLESPGVTGHLLCTTRWQKEITVDLAQV